MKKFILILFILVGFNLNAALAPLYQSIKEIEHVLKDESLKEQLSSGDAVLEVKRVENGYLVYTSKYVIQVDIKYARQDLIGPAKFELYFHEKELY